MRTHRLARFVAILLFLVALVYFIVGAVVGLLIWSRGLGAGWGSGFTGWIAIPILASTLFGAVTLLLFGAMLYFLARIDTNLALTQKAMLVPKKTRPAPAAATFEPPAPLVPPEAAPAPAEPIIVAPTVAVEAPAVAAAAAAGAAVAAGVTAAIAAGKPALEAAQSEIPIEPPQVALEGDLATAAAIAAAAAESTKEKAAAVVEAVETVAASAPDEIERATAIATAAAAEQLQAELPQAEMIEAVAAASAQPAEEQKAAPAAAGSHGVDAFVIGLGRLALGKGPGETAAGAPSEPALPPDVEAELPELEEESAAEEFTGKLPGLDEASRIASELAAAKDVDKSA